MTDEHSARDAAMDAYLRAEDAKKAAGSSPAAPAGWYEFPEMVNTVRYWDGGRWTEHFGPAAVTTSAPPAPAARPAKAATTHKCPYCGEAIGVQATRCPHCSGQRMHCSNCKALRGVSERQKWVGMARGGKQTVHSCLVCGKQLSGPRW